MMNEKEKIAQNYFKYKKLTVHSNKIEDIDFYIRKFIFFRKNKAISKYEDSDLLDFLDSLRPSYATGTFNNIKIYCKNFIKWHFTDWSSRFKNLDKLGSTEKTETRYTPEDMRTEKDFEKIVQAEEEHSWKAYFLTLFYGCCRPIEVCRLKWKDVQFETNGEGAYITIFSQKNKRSFIKYLPEKATFYLKQIQNNNLEWVFPSKYTNQRKDMPVTVKGAYWRIKYLSKKSLGKKIDLYTIRHSIATINYNKEGIKDDDVARQMGHSKSMKEKYVHNSLDKLKEKAKRIYLEPEMLPPEKKYQLEKEIENLKTAMAVMMQKFERRNNLDSHLDILIKNDQKEAIVENK